MLRLLMQVVLIATLVVLGTLQDLSGLEVRFLSGGDPGQIGGGVGTLPNCTKIKIEKKCEPDQPMGKCNESYVTWANGYSGLLLTRIPGKAVEGCISVGCKKVDYGSASLDCIAVIKPQTNTTYLAAGFLIS